MSAKLSEVLDALVAKYRELPFATWEAAHRTGERRSDYATCSIEDLDWWQAHTDVLELVDDPDGRRWAHVCITVYPRGVHTVPPAPSSAIAVYADGAVEGKWSNGAQFQFVRTGSLTGEADPRPG